MRHVNLEYKVYFDNEMVVVYKGIYEGEMNYDPKEVAEGEFFNVNKLPAPLTPWFLEDWNLIKKDDPGKV